MIQAIEVIHSKTEWGAEVVYGDTDSLFVYLPGRSREEAFDIGEDIAETITGMNPPPIKLKFEKVFPPMKDVQRRSRCTIHAFYLPRSVM
jgi:DNA polymerase zeta